MAKQVSMGKCNICGGAFDKAAITKHLKSCSRAKIDSTTSDGSPGRQKTKAFHLVAEGRYLPDYWMHLEVPTNAKLEVLDSFLRQTWLECCGHMSAFTIEGKTYSVAPSRELGDKSMNARLSDVVYPSVKFYHEYDFGTTTYLALKVISEQESDIKAGDVRVLARNEPPPIPCGSCGKAATRVCTECLWSDKGGWLCDACAAKHKRHEDMFLPVVNSPRVGMCGYNGH